MTPYVLDELLLEELDELNKSIKYVPCTTNSSISVVGKLTIRISSLPRLALVNVVVDASVVPEVETVAILAGEGSVGLVHRSKVTE